ncbi:MAG: ATP-binding cassette domain-containing protein [Candidatus Izemoplasmataceae bacterium]
MIKVNNLSFSYTKKPFIEALSFEINKGEIFGFLGPSGAGKSTLQKILTGVLSGYHGEVLVNDIEVKTADKAFYEKIGVDFEFPSLYEKLTAKQNLDFFASLYPKFRDIEALLTSVDLAFNQHKKVMHYSKGMKSRLNFIKALVHDPDVLFLDEPTSGLDPTNARMMKDIILEEKRKGKTIILTTHNMHDAAELCDRVAFIVDGAIRALDTPRNLIMSKGATKISYTYLNSDQENSKTIHLNETNKDDQLIALIKANKLRSIHSSEPTLNDIFVEVTGRTLL